MYPPDVFLRSVGTALPGPPVTNAMLARRFNMTPLWEQWVEAFVGTHTRHLAVDLESGEVRYNLADLGEAAARKALRDVDLPPSAIDLVVMATSSPDTLMPATVNVIADRLGINDVSTYQLQSGCTGALQAIDIAHRLLLTGRHQTALVIGGDVIAKHYDLNADPRSLPPAQQINGVLFGDGAGAAILDVAPAPGADRIRHVFTRLVGLNRPPGQIVEWFGLADRGSDRPAAVEDYKAIEESVPTMAAEALDEVLTALGWHRGDIDYLLPPQLSGRMTARIAKRMDAPLAHEVTCVEQTGNTGNALPFFQLERTLPKMDTADRAIAIAIESSKWIKAGLALERA